MANNGSDEVDDQGNASKATGASGGGSFGNQRGAPVTGGAPENGKRGEGDVHPEPDASPRGNRAGDATEGQDKEEHKEEDKGQAKR
ncbi:hypothetical protein [Paraburkholderia kirstenboschensis]|uniref:Uncharacterized protein n=1 Tax=Paraburkholderia kirstenboschensis TaxID=1245436 RepID=A0ABZ0EHR1_9BURK|nr:hypothetical protein [Paraburkholderia kirstenboschensis]WOD16756.1 hypothetical protein RW095_12830 [Paraburkholderia kirstenboschensis]